MISNTKLKFEEKKNFQKYYYSILYPVQFLPISFSMKKEDQNNNGKKFRASRYHRARMDKARRDFYSGAPDSTGMQL